jgi:hypothetical protein
MNQNEHTVEQKGIFIAHAMKGYDRVLRRLPLDTHAPRTMNADGCNKARRIGLARLFVLTSCNETKRD